MIKIKIKSVFKEKQDQTLMINPIKQKVKINPIEDKKKNLK